LGEVGVAKERHPIEFDDLGSTLRGRECGEQVSAVHEILLVPDPFSALWEISARNPLMCGELKVPKLGQFRCCRALVSRRLLSAGGTPF
jgi:hypothetical protein